MNKSEPSVINGLAHDLRNPVLVIGRESKRAVQALEVFDRAMGRCPYRHEPGAACSGVQGEGKLDTTEKKIVDMARYFGVDPAWALAIAEVESSVGEHQLSPTGAKGVFQMTSIAMKDLLLEMQAKDDDMIDIACGILFLRLLKKRWGSIEEATSHYCDPNDRHFYISKVLALMADEKK